MTTIQEEIESLKKEAAGKLLEAEKLQRLLTAYPDLQKHVGRWKKVAYCSASVNSKVNRFDLHHNCGCCTDSPLEFWPYLETPDGNVYANPPSFQVGEKHYMGGDVPYSGWKERLEKVGIPEAVIGAVVMHFKECKQARIRTAEEDDEVPEDPEPFV
jgi:hypothetical protein